MNMQKNTPPADAFEVLKRLNNCNWAQLADHLGVTAQTLRQWRAGDGGRNASMRMQHLMEATLREANADWLLLQTNWQNVATVRGRR